VQIKLSKLDINDMILKEHAEIVDDLIENLKAFSGTGKNKKPFLSKGLKIYHNKSGLIYTVLKLIDGEDGVALLCTKPDGKLISVSGSSFNEYSRL
jgi:hypothetical protein